MDKVQFYVVCLTNRPDRVKNVEIMKQKIPDLIVVDAIDGSLLKKEDFEKMTEDGLLVKNSQGYMDQYIKDRPMSVGNVGSFLSHTKAIELVSRQDKKYGIVLEDDIHLHEDFFEKLNIVLTQYVNELDFDIVHLYVFPSQQRVFPKVDKPQIHKTPVGLYGLQCYLMKKITAGKVLHKLYPINSATDIQITRVGLKSYTLNGMTLIDGELIKSYTTSTVNLNDILDITQEEKQDDKAK